MAEYDRRSSRFGKQERSSGQIGRRSNRTSGHQVEAVYTGFSNLPLDVQLRRDERIFARFRDDEFDDEDFDDDESEDIQTVESTSEPETFAASYRDGGKGEIANQENSEETTQDESELGWLEWLFGSLAGEFNSDPSASQIGMDLGVSLIPILDQMADARDILAHAYWMLFRGEYNSPGRWVSLAFTLIGVVPEIGSVIKSISKYAIKGTEEAAQHIDEILGVIAPLLPDGGVAGVQRVLASNWDNWASSGKQLWVNSIQRLRGAIDAIPGVPGFRQRKQNALAQLDELLAVGDEMLDTAFAEARRRLDEILEWLGIRRGQQLAMATEGGGDASRRGTGQPGRDNEPSRMQGNQPEGGGNRGSGRVREEIAESILSDSELIAAVQRGYPNPEHMRELLARTDLAPELLQQARRELSTAINSGKYSSGNIQRVITQLRSGRNADQFAEALAELSRPNRLIRGGSVADDSPVILGAEEGTEYVLGGASRVDPAPVPDADVLYKGTDGITHIEEVKNTASALRQKLDESPKQLSRLQDWRKADPNNRTIRIVIETEAGWTEIFAVKKNQPAVLTKLIENNVPLSVGSYDFSIEQMKIFPDAIASKAQQMKQNGTWNGWKDFYNQMSTPAKAEEFLGISLR